MKTKYILKNDEINGIKVVSYDYKVIETKGRLIITEAIEAVKAVKEVLAVEEVLNSDGVILVKAIEYVAPIKAIEAVEYSEFQEKSTFEEKQISPAHTVRIYPNYVFTDKDAQEVIDFANEAFTNEVKQAYTDQQEALKPTAEQIKAANKALLKNEIYFNLETMTVTVSSGKVFAVPMSSYLGYLSKIEELEEKGVDEDWWTLADATYVVVSLTDLKEAFKLGKRAGTKINDEYHLAKSKLKGIKDEISS